MNWIDDALRDFGRSMGIAGLQFGGHAATGLAFERRGALFVERAGDAVLVYLARQTPGHDGAWDYRTKPPRSGLQPELVRPLGEFQCN